MEHERTEISAGGTGSGSGSSGANIYNLDFGLLSGSSAVVPDFHQSHFAPHPGHSHKYGYHPSTSSNSETVNHNFHPPGMDNELYNLLLNASEKEFPIEINLPQNSSKGATEKKPTDQQQEPRNSSNGNSNAANIRNNSNEHDGHSIKARNGRKRKFTTSTETADDNVKDTGKTPSDKEPAEEEKEITSSVEGDDDELQVKRNRRLVKNREAAQLFRQRQKAYINDLEQKVEKLSTENVTLQSKVDLLSAENKLIKEQLGYLRNFISQVTMTFPFPYNQVRNSF